MKYILSIVIIFVLISCEKEDEEFIYSYKITKVNRTPSNFVLDSIIFYYDNQDKLLKIANYDSESSYQAMYPLYEGDAIKLGSKQYLLNDQNRIDSLIYDIDNTVCYTYENDYIVHEFLTRNNTVVEEHFRSYSEGEILKDSAIYNAKNITVYHHMCTDTPAPDFMVHYTGFKEYPQYSKYLIGESIAPEAGIKDICSYEIFENELTVHRKTIDMFHNDTVDMPSTKYAYDGR